MRFPTLLRNFFHLDIVRDNWRLLVAFFGGVILTGIIVESPYVKSAINQALLSAAPPVTDIIISGDWFYETISSDRPFEYEGIKCTSIQGQATINQPKNSYEFDITALRRLCIDDETTKSIKRNVFWDAKNSSMIFPARRAFIINLRTDDNRIGFVTGSISEEEGKQPGEFLGRMYYLNDIEKTYRTSTIRFCKVSTNCGKDISNRIKSIGKN